MGQWYSVCLGMKPKRGKSADVVAEYNAIRKEMTDTGHAVFSEKEEPPVRSIVGIAKDLLAARQKEFRRVNRGGFTSCFHGSYGWESVMVSVFERLAPHLEDGSVIEMDMDEGCRTLIVENGGVREGWENNEPDEEDNNNGQ